jgi:hypothetical protein
VTGTTVSLILTASTQTQHRPLIGRSIKKDILRLVSFHFHLDNNQKSSPQLHDNLQVITLDAYRIPIWESFPYLKRDRSAEQSIRHRRPLFRLDCIKAPSNPSPAKHHHHETFTAGSHRTIRSSTHIRSTLPIPPDNNLRSKPLQIGSLLNFKHKRHHHSGKSRQ